MIVEGKLVNKTTGKEPFTLGNIHDCGNEYVVYDGADYIGFNKSEYEVISIKEK